jgi:hypothetical protein
MQLPPIGVYFYSSFSFSLSPLSQRFDKYGQPMIVLHSAHKSVMPSPMEAYNEEGKEGKDEEDEEEPVDFRWYGSLWYIVLDIRVCLHLEQRGFQGSTVRVKQLIRSDDCAGAHK